MPSAFTHAFSAVALGTAFGRKKILKLTIIGAICSAIPDLDVIAFSFGIPYESVWGHRGITHSFFFAAILSIVVMLLFYKNLSLSKEWGILFLYFFLATSLHPLLDALTNGGLGVAFFAPFENSRYFFSFRPIRVSPMSVERFFTMRGFEIFRNEFIWVWLPCIVIMILVRLQKAWKS